MTIKEFAAKFEMSDKGMWQFLYDYNSYTSDESKQIHLENNDDELTDEQVEDMARKWKYMYDLDSIASFRKILNYTKRVITA